MVRDHYLKREVSLQPSIWFSIEMNIIYSYLLKSRIENHIHLYFLLI